MFDLPQTEKPNELITLKGRVAAVETSKDTLSLVPLEMVASGRVIYVDREDIVERKPDIPNIKWGDNSIIECPANNSVYLKRNGSWLKLSDTDNNLYYIGSDKDMNTIFSLNGKMKVVKFVQPEPDDVEEF